MKRVIFVCSQKGGAGKTTFARGLLEALRYEGITVAAYDADGAVGQLLQYEGARDRKGALLPRQDPRVGCGDFDIRDDDDRDILLNALADEPPVLLFDLPQTVANYACWSALAPSRRKSMKTRNFGGRCWRAR